MPTTATVEPPLADPPQPETALWVSLRKKLNALNAGLFDELEEALDETEAGDAIALILTGEGRAFGAGTDISGSEMHAASASDFANIGSCACMNCCCA